MEEVKVFEIISEVEVEKLLKQLDELEVNTQNSKNEEKQYNSSIKGF